MVSSKAVAASKSSTKSSTKSSSKSSTQSFTSSKARASKAKKVAKPRAPRTTKRHLVRWTELMDKKLLLAIHYQCNKERISLPMDAIAEIMGPGITGSAVGQHLSKLRTRLIEQNEQVPPPLQRGGGCKLALGQTQNTRAVNAAKKRAAQKAAADQASMSGSEAEETNTASDLDEEKTPAASAYNHSSDQDTDDNSSNGEVEHGDQPGSRVVAAYAPFLKLEDDIPGEVKPSKVVTLSLKKESLALLERDTIKGRNGDRSDDVKEEPAVSFRDQPYASNNAFDQSHGLTVDSRSNFANGVLPGFADHGYPIGNLHPLYGAQYAFNAAGQPFDFMMRNPNVNMGYSPYMPLHPAASRNLPFPNGQIPSQAPTTNTPLPMAPVSQVPSNGVPGWEFEHLPDKVDQDFDDNDVFKDEDWGNYGGYADDA